MKKLMFIAAFTALVNLSFAQKLQKGNLIGVHVLTVTLKPGVTMEQFKTFYLSKSIPAYEIAFKGTKGFLLDGRRGESKDKLAIAWHFETEQDRDKFFKEDGFTDMGNAAVAAVSDVDKELEKLGTSTDVFTDWVIQ